MRLNTVLATPLAELHEVDKISNLETEGLQIWKGERGNKELLDNLAHKLLASSFYFVVKTSSVSKESYNVTGKPSDRLQAAFLSHQAPRRYQVFQQGFSPWGERQDWRAV